MRFNSKLTGALTALAVAAAITAPATYATPLIDPPSPAVKCDPSDVPPPPSSIAADGNRAGSSTVYARPWGDLCGTYPGHDLFQERVGD
jgi:hypothetical protein